MKRAPKHPKLYSVEEVERTRPRRQRNVRAVDERTVRTVEQRRVRSADERRRPEERLRYNREDVQEMRRSRPQGRRPSEMNPQRKAYLERKRKRQKAKNIFKAIACVLAAIIIAALLVLLIPSWKSAVFKWALKSPFGPGIANMIMGKSYEENVRDKDFDPSKIRVNEGISTPEGYLTFALFGVDARQEDIKNGIFSDSIIVLNIDEQGTIQMNSVYRDTYLLTRGAEGDIVVSKANSAYFRNGPVGAINMLNENFDLAIKDYVVVNFWGLENIINILGGLRLRVTDTEREHLNYYMQEQCVVGGTEFIPLEESGDDVLLTGAQATAFCRLRDCSFESPLDNETYTDDYARTARQRYALTQLIMQSREKGMLNLLKIANQLFEANNGEKRFIQTSFTMGELCKVLAKAYDMKLGENRAFPDINYQYTQILDVGDSIVADTLEENVTLMHDFMYKTNGYVPSNDLSYIANIIRADIDSQ